MRYVDAIPGAVSGSGGHNATFAVACALVKGFNLSSDQAMALLQRWNGKCDPHWSDKDLLHKVTQANSSPDDQPRGYLAGAGRHETGELPASSARPLPKPKPKPVYDPELLSRMAAKVGQKVDLVYLANRSAVDPATVTIDGFLRAVVPAEGKVLIFNQINAQGAQVTQGEALWPDDEAPWTGKGGVWWLPQPVDGVYRIQPDVNKDGKPKTSRRAGNCCQSFPYLVIESDEAPVLEWMAVLVQLPLRIVAIYTSGGRSVHALVRIDATTKGHWDVLVKGDDLSPEAAGMAAGMKALILNGADKGVLSAVRLTRLPGAYREGKMKKLEDGRMVYQKFDKPILQKLLYLNPGADGRPICELMARRDVIECWYAEADALRMDASQEEKYRVMDGMAYYAPVSETMRRALRALRGGLAAVV